jgi:hypothetical protein
LIGSFIAVAVDTIAAFARGAQKNLDQISAMSRAA